MAAAAPAARFAQLGVGGTFQALGQLGGLFEALQSPAETSIRDIPFAGIDPFSNPLLQALMLESLFALGSPSALNVQGASPISQLAVAVGSSGLFSRKRNQQLTRVMGAVSSEVEKGIAQGLSQAQIQANIDALFDKKNPNHIKEPKASLDILTQALGTTEFGSIGNLIQSELDFRTQTEQLREEFDFESFLKPIFEQRREIEQRLLEETAGFPETQDILETVQGFEPQEIPEFLTDVGLAQQAEGFAVSPEMLPAIPGITPFGREDIEALASEIEAGEIARLDEQFGERERAILMQAQFQGVNPGALLAELEQERQIQLSQIREFSLQRAIQLRAGEQGLVSANIGDIGAVQNLLAARPAIGQELQQLTGGNLALAGQLQGLSGLDLQLLLQPLFAQQQLAIQGIEGLAAALQPGFQQAVQAAGPSVTTQLGAADIAAAQIPAITGAMVSNAQLEQAQRELAADYFGGLFGAGTAMVNSSIGGIGDMPSQNQGGPSGFS